MAAPLLSVSGLGKAYRRYRGEGQRLLSLLGLRVAPVDEHWVLRDVSFDVRAGEAVGIVGHNGAGKSTLLKIITGTVRPTVGRVGTAGRIAAILELGMGFSPELSGRANVLHSGSLMGFDRAFLECAIPEIEAFAEIGDYFDEPVRTYSSGMQVRVAFALATVARPEILIIDEALSVGDAYFQHKSFDRIRRFRDEGSTLLIVSHDKAAVQTLCSRALLLDHGRLVRDGDPVEITDYYNALMGGRDAGHIAVSRHESGQARVVSGTGEARVEHVTLLDVQERPVEVASVGQPLELRATVRAFADLPRLVLGYQIKDRLGQVVFGTNTFHTGQVVNAVRAGDRLRYRIRFPADLAPGTYSVSTALVSTDTHLVDNFEWQELALVFTVANVGREYFEGIAWIPPEIGIERP